MKKKGIRNVTLGANHKHTTIIKTEKINNICKKKNPKAQQKY